MSHKQVPAFAFADDIAHWQNIANDRRLSLGQFITECVEDVYGGKPESWRVTYGSGRVLPDSAPLHFSTLDEALGAIAGLNDKYTIERLDGEGNPVYKEPEHGYAWAKVTMPGKAVVTEVVKEPLYQVRFRQDGRWSDWHSRNFNDASALVSIWSKNSKALVEQVEIRIKPTEDK